jgi:hypothetical protein
MILSLSTTCSCKRCVSLYLQAPAAHALSRFESSARTSAVYPPSPPPKRASPAIAVDAPVATKRSSTEAGFTELAAGHELARKAPRSTTSQPLLEHNLLNAGGAKPAVKDTSRESGWRFPNSSATLPKGVFRKRFTGRPVPTSVCRFGRFDTPVVEPTAEQAAEVSSSLLTVC